MSDLEIEVLGYPKRSILVEPALAMDILYGYKNEIPVPVDTAYRSSIILVSDISDIPGTLSGYAFAIARVKACKTYRKDDKVNNYILELEHVSAIKPFKATAREYVSEVMQNDMNGKIEFPPRFGDLTKWKQENVFPLINDAVYNESLGLYFIPYHRNLDKTNNQILKKLGLLDLSNTL